MADEGTNKGCSSADKPQDDVLCVLPLVVQRIDSLESICNSLQVCSSMGTYFRAWRPLAMHKVKELVNTYQQLQKAG